MPSYGSKSGGRGRAGARAAQTMIDRFEIDSSKRRAKIIGVLSGIAAALLTFIITVTTNEVGTAFFLATVFGIGIGAAIAGLILAWPGLRIAWHWAGELVLLGFLISIYILLYSQFGALVALGVMLQIVILPWLIRPVCRFLIRWGMCMVVRHRIRVSCDAFIEGKGVHGSVMPLILWAHPTASGERVWLWLRGDLTLEDIQARLNELASVCWANSADVNQAGRKKAFVVMNIHRRDVLADGVDMPIEDMLDGIDPESYPTEFGTVSDANGVDIKPEDMDDEVSELLGSNRGGRKPRTKKKEDTSPTRSDDSEDSDVPDWI